MSLPRLAPPQRLVRRHEYSYFGLRPRNTSDELSLDATILIHAEDAQATGHSAEGATGGSQCSVLLPLPPFDGVLDGGLRNSTPSPKPTKEPALKQQTQDCQ